MGLLDGGIASAIAAGFKGKLLSGTLTKTTVMGRDANGDPTTTPVNYSIQGFKDTYSAIMIAAGGIPVTDSRIILIAGLCAATPAIQDKLQLGGQTFQIRNIARDPADATFDLQCFAVPS